MQSNNIKRCKVQKVTTIVNIKCECNIFLYLPLIFFLFFFLLSYNNIIMELNSYKTVDDQIYNSIYLIFLALLNISNFT